MLYLPDRLKNSELPALLAQISPALRAEILWQNPAAPEEALALAQNLLPFCAQNTQKNIFSCLEQYYSSLFTQFSKQEFNVLIQSVQSLCREKINPKISLICDFEKQRIYIKEYCRPSPPQCSSPVSANRSAAQTHSEQNTPVPHKSAQNKNVVYTCITGSYDSLIQHGFHSSNWDYLCFTDQENLIKQKTAGHWQIQPLRFKTENPQLTGRWHKIHPHELLKNYEQSLYVDGNINVLSPYLFELAKQKQHEYILGQFMHPVRDCIYDEILACLAGQKESKAKLDRVAKLLAQNRFPAHWGLSETGILFRKHHDPACMRIMDEWWYMLENYSVRDQVSLMYILWKNNMRPEWMCPHAYRKLKYDFTVIPHKKTIIIT